MNMKQQKIHLKLKSKAICGIKRKKNRLKFADDEQDVTCENCKRAVKT